MKVRPIVLLDLDGVLLDDSRYDAEWQRLADDACLPRLGGTRGLWAPALHTAWLDAARALLARPPAERPAPEIWWRELQAHWIELACPRAGARAPSSAAERAQAARDALAHYFRHTDAPVPGAAAAIVDLARDCELHMSSGNPSFMVELALERLGVRALVGHAFGSDLLGVHKQQAEHFYRVLFARIGADPGDAFVVDDMDAPLAAAHALGARTIKIGDRPGAAPHARLLATFALVPAAIAGD
jgi:phosphoglycolate phosphatase-like HAD superfamily hydrolase